MRIGPVTLTEEEPPTPRRRLVAALLVTALLAVVAGGGWYAFSKLYPQYIPKECSATALGRTVNFAPDQMSNAATITAIALKRDLPARAATIALATAIQESKLRNIKYGDRDSLGLFQQRPSQGWGTPEQILDPHHATNAFYDALIKVDTWQQGSITVVAQEVQKSAYPEAYADHEQEGRLLASTLAGHSPEGLVCRLPTPERPGSPDLVVSLVDEEYGLTAQSAGGAATIAAPSEQIAWSLGHWSVAKAIDTGATSVTVGDRMWTRTDKDWHEADAPTGPTTVTIRFS